jgi:hypothetical protein
MRWQDENGGNGNPQPPPEPVAPDDAPDSTDAPPPRVRLKFVSFSGAQFRPVLRDDGAGEYTSPHWQDNTPGLDGDASDDGDLRLPVSYFRGATARVSAGWVVEPILHSKADAMFRGRCSGGITLPPTRAISSPDGLLILPPTDAAQPFPDHIEAYLPFQIDWQFSPDGGETWEAAGQSDNRLYVTLAEKRDDCQRFETVMHISCTNGRPAADAAAAVNGIWQGFSPVRMERGLTRKPVDGFNHADGRRMTFWGPQDDSGRATHNATTLVEMLRVTEEVHATCAAWAALLHHAFAVHGVPALVLHAQSQYANDPSPGADGAVTRGGFLIKEWTFAADGTFDGHCQDFTHRFVGEVSPSTPTPGQGNQTPPSSFLEHFLVLADTKIFDPSYGKGPFEARQSADRRVLSGWEDESMSGYVKRCSDDEVVAKRNTLQAPEMDYRARPPR